QSEISAAALKFSILQLTNKQTLIIQFDLKRKDGGEAKRSSSRTRRTELQPRESEEEDN
ncbi:hypothetical protein A2U01_0072179, partial [Trifolium medium]|nr:hypothetical protein [Trifolium medium]